MVNGVVGVVYGIVYQWILIIEKIYILVFVVGPTDGLDHTAIAAEAKYYVNVTKSRKKIQAKIFVC